ncbi:carboxypeptidase regulatory-like domain-containing protein [bacterium]|nr:carboxypeptidase regulatory-like domain-containing protein [bacterium]
MKPRWIIFLVFCSILTARPDFIRPVTAAYDHAPLRTVLEDLSDKTRLKFVFYDDLVENRSVTCDFSTRSATILLNRIILPLGLFYEKTSPQVITLYHRNMKPRSWVLQGQVLTGPDSAVVEGASVSVGENGRTGFTDVQGCFVFMDILESPCAVTVQHPEYQVQQLTVDSLRAFYTIVLVPRPVQKLKTGNVPEDIRARHGPDPVVHRTGLLSSVFSRAVHSVQISRFELWVPADRIHAQWNGIYPEYPGQPVFRAESVNPAGRDFLPVPDPVRFIPGISGLLFEDDRDKTEIQPLDAEGYMNRVMIALDPWQTGLSARMQTRSGIQFAGDIRKSVFWPSMNPLHQNTDDYQQLIRFQTLRPVRDHVQDVLDWNGRLGWMPGLRDTIGIQFFRSGSAWDTSVDYMDSPGLSETRKDEANCGTYSANWRRAWKPGRISELRFGTLSQDDRYTYANPRIGADKWTEKDHLKRTGAAFRHTERIRPHWNMAVSASAYRLTLSHPSGCASVHPESENTILGLGLEHRFDLSVLCHMKGALNADYLSGPGQWMFNPQVLFHTMLDEHTGVNLRWKRIPLYVHTIVNRIRTGNYWMTPVIRLGPDSWKQPGFADRLSLQVNRFSGTRNLDFSFFYERRSRTYSVIPYDADAPAESVPFQEGNGFTAGFTGSAEAVIHPVVMRTVYQVEIARIRFPYNNGNRYYTPDGERGHRLEFDLQTAPMKINTALHGIFCSGASFAEYDPEYRMTESGPDYRPEMPEGPWTFMKTPVYFRLDLSVYREFRIRNRNSFVFGMSVLNGLNRANVIGPYYYIEPSRPFTQMPQLYRDMNDLPRTAYLYLQFYFSL